MRARASLLVAAMLLGWVGVATPAQGLVRSADTERGVSISLSSLTPLAPTPTDLLTIVGTVANSSDTTIQSVTVRLRADSTPITDRSVLADLTTSNVTGAIVDNTRTTPVAALEPGQSAPFTITAPIRALGLSDAGVHTIAVEAQSDPGDGNLERVGLLRTVITYFPSPAETPVTGLVTLWPLSEVPAVTSDGVVLNDRLPQAMAPGGRLRVLLDSGGTQASALTWLVDPALLQIASSMSDGYRIKRGAEVVVGERPDQAADWIDDLRRVTARNDVFALPYAVPDAVAMVRAGLARDLTRTITTAGVTAATELRRPLPSVLAWPTNGVVDRPTLRVIVDAAPRGVLMSAGQLRSTSDITPSGAAPIPGSAGSATAVVPDLMLGMILTGTRGAPTNTIEARQRLLAELALIGQQTSAQRTVVMSPSLGWSPTSAFVTEILGAITRVPWIRPTTLATLLGSEPSSIPRELRGYPVGSPGSELPPDYMGKIATTQASVATVGDVVAGATPQTLPMLAALERAASGWFRSEQRTGSELVSDVARTAADELDGIRIISKGTVTLPGDTGIIPLSISNTLNSPVTVGLSLTANPTVRLTTDPVAPITIPPRSTTLVEVPARVSGSGQVALVVRLTSPSGTPFGQSAELEVGTSAYARAATWVVAAAFGILVFLLGVNFVRRLRSRSQEPMS